MHNRRTLLLSILIFVLISTAVTPLLGQAETIITITGPGWVSRAFTPEVFAPFEAQHPGVKVVVADAGQDYYYPSGADNIEEHLDGAEKYAGYADVLYVDHRMASVEATRAGYFMNLAPYVNSDFNFNTDDFFPKIWQSALWDDGIWYIPASAYVSVIMYDANAFDKAGAAYPNENWSFEDFAQAARALTTYKADGSVDVPGFPLYDLGLVFYGLNGQPFYDPGVSPSVPKFDNPALPAFAEQWVALNKDISTGEQYDYDAVAFNFGAPWQFYNRNGDNWGSSLLPGGVSSLSIEGFAVSGGTLNPELSYALANFVSTSPEIIDAFGGNTPARRSMVIPNSSRVSDYQAIFDQALENAVPTSELRFGDYVEAAIDSQIADGVQPDFTAALQEAQLKALSALETAAQRRTNTTVYVITPIPTPSFSEGQIVLRFGMGSDISSTRETWNQITSDFLAANPAVGNVELVTDFFEERVKNTLDCYFMPYSEVPSLPLVEYLSLDPLMNADSNFDPNDFIGTTLEQVKRDGQTWAYPIIIQPSVMWYDQNLFNQAGLPSPEQGWTIDAFRDALQTLKGLQAKETDPVFVPGTYGNTYLLMLIAAFGGIPYDYRTSPPTINYTDPATVEAIRQTLDLARENYIGYASLYDNRVFTSVAEASITDDVLSIPNWRLQERDNPASELTPLYLANFPQGSQYTPVAYSVGAAYIRSTSQNPDACYQWIAAIAKRPDLLGGMPARVSQVNDPMLTTALGEEVASIYQGFLDTFQNPNTLTFPGPYSGDTSFSSYVEPMWLNRAFDRYVLEDADLDTELAAAETAAKAYRECASVIPVMTLTSDASEDEVNAYYKQFADCAILIDPTIKDQFSYLYPAS